MLLFLVRRTEKKEAKVGGREEGRNEMFLFNSGIFFIIDILTK